MHSDKMTINTANPRCLVSTCALCCIPGWIHMGSGACSTCKITTSKRMGLERRRKWDIGERRKWDWTENNPIADVCLAPKKCGCKNECSSRCTCKRTRLPCTSLCTCLCEHVLFFDVRHIVGAVQYVQMLL